MRRLLPTIAFVLVLAMPAATQKSAAPDLSGTWVLNLSKSKEINRAVVLSEKLVVTCSGLNVTMHFTTDGRNVTNSYVADGKEHLYAQGHGGAVPITAYWKKSSLIVEYPVRWKSADSPDDDAGEVSHVVNRWTLSADGHTLTDESEGFDMKTVRVYDKQ